MSHAFHQGILDAGTACHLSPFQHLSKKIGGPGSQTGYGIDLGNGVPDHWKGCVAGRCWHPLPKPWRFLVAPAHGLQGWAWCPGSNGSWHLYAHSQEFLPNGQPMLFGPVQGGWHHLGLPCGQVLAWLWLRCAHGSTWWEVMCLKHLAPPAPLSTRAHCHLPPLPSQASSLWSFLLLAPWMHSFNKSWKPALSARVVALQSAPPATPWQPWDSLAGA